MIANTIATGGKDTGIQPFFRTVVEKFGRKVATMTHGDHKGIGNRGAGMTPKVFDLLNHYNLKAAVSWLFNFNRSANSRLLPSWMPVLAKIKASIDADTHLHVIANGDQYFTEYVKSPNHNMSAMLPCPSDPLAFLCKQFAILDAIKNGQTLDALKMLDIAGTESSNTMLLQLAFAMQAGPFKDVRSSWSLSASTTAMSLAALALELKKNKVPKEDFTKKWMKQLAPFCKGANKQEGCTRELLEDLPFPSLDQPSQQKTNSSQHRLVKPSINNGTYQ
jgi:hypothetical protein